MSINTGRAAAEVMGGISGIHAVLHKWLAESDTLTDEDKRDIDSAQVFLEAAHDKLAVVLNRRIEGEKEETDQ